MLVVLFVVAVGAVAIAIYVAWSVPPERRVPFKTPKVEEDVWLADGARPPWETPPAPVEDLD